MNANEEHKTKDAAAADRIDAVSDSALRDWAKRLDVSPEQIKEAIAQVGDSASDVELHLKGTRSSTTEDRVEAAD